MNNIRYNNLYDRLYDTRNACSVDSDDVVNTIDFRRKLLRFDQPGCDNEKPYVQYTIPRYYSEFRPWFHQCFKFPKPEKHCVSEYKEIQYKEPIVEIVSEPVSTNNYQPFLAFVFVIMILYLLLNSF
jgi:hypothetical protein